MIGSTIAPIFFNTMEDSGALPLEMDVKDLAMGDLIDLCVYEQVVKKHGTNDVLVKFDLKHELMLDQAVVVHLNLNISCMFYKKMEVMRVKRTECNEMSRIKDKRG